MENPYKILECSKFDSLENIKRNGKRLLFKHHPDKNESGESDQFIRIRHAYQTVLKEKEKEDFIMKQFNEISYAMLAFINVYMNYCLTKPKTIQIDLEVSLDDVINRRVKRIVYKRYVSGRLERHTIYIDLSTFQKSYIFDELGDENVFMKCFGNVEVNLILSKRNSNLEEIKVVDDYNINSIMTVDLYEYLYGIKITMKDKVIIDHIPYIDGEEMTLKTLIQDTQLHIRFKLILSLDQTVLLDTDFKNMIQRKFHNKVAEEKHEVGESCE